MSTKTSTRPSCPTRLKRRCCACTAGTRIPPAVADALSRAARDHRAAVMVLGSRGRSAIREIMLGSVAMSTLHRVHRLVMVVPAHEATDAITQPDSRRRAAR
ncbi:universal stress protein [Solwaraspora sp. WMMD1047]|nr:universal stress protein [Solwaraspora sp. WMMD1047]MDG4833900.1 universal stress protein [Solwaraspora sp. WMMD1047]